MNVVVFCGAGLSVSIGMPTMTNFNSKVEASKSLSDEEKACYWEIVRRCSSTGLVAGASARNLEDLVSILEVLKITQPKLELVPTEKLTAADALQVVRACIAHVCQPSKPNHSNCQELVRRLASVHTTSFVTTNYDMNIELGAAEAGVGLEFHGLECAKLASGGSVGQRRLYVADTIINEIMTRDPLTAKLYKLHGSVNWRLDGETPTIEDRLDDRNGRQFVLTALTPQEDVSQSTVLVAPSFFKQFDHPLLLKQWSGAAAALASAHSILVLGYSFPASDRMMRYFFASALEQNNVLQRIVFIDPNAGHIRAANRDFLESPNIRNLVSYFPCKWEEIDLHIVQKIASGEYVPNPNDSVLSAIQQSVNARDLIRRGSEP